MLDPVFLARLLAAGIIGLTLALCTGKESGAWSRADVHTDCCENSAH